MEYPSSEILDYLQAIASQLPVEEMEEEYESYDQYTHNGDPSGIPIYRMPDPERQEELADLSLPQGFDPAIEVVYLEKSKVQGLRPHKHLESDAVFKKISGEGAAVVDGYRKELGEKVVAVPRGAWHNLSIAEDSDDALVFISIQYPNIAETEGEVDIEYLPSVNIHELQDALWKRGSDEIESFDPSNFGQWCQGVVDSVLEDVEGTPELKYYLHRNVFSFYNPIDDTWSKAPHMWPEGKGVAEDLIEVYGRLQHSHVSSFYYEKLSEHLERCEGITGRNRPEEDGRTVTYHALEDGNEPCLTEVRLHDQAGSQPARRKALDALNEDAIPTENLEKLQQALVNLGIEMTFSGKLKSLFKEAPSYALGFLWLALDDEEYRRYSFVPSPSSSPVVSLVPYWKDEPNPNVLSFLRELQLFLTKEIFARVEQTRAAEAQWKLIFQQLRHNVNFYFRKISEDLGTGNDMSLNRGVVGNRVKFYFKEVKALIDLSRHMDQPGKYLSSRAKTEEGGPHEVDVYKNLVWPVVELMGDCIEHRPEAFRWQSPELRTAVQEAYRRNNLFEFEFEKDTQPFRISTFPDVARLILKDIISNAIKYQSDTNPWVEICFTSQTESLEVTVSNSVPISQAAWRLWMKGEDNDELDNALGIKICRTFMEPLGWQHRIPEECIGTEGINRTDIILTITSVDK